METLTAIRMRKSTRDFNPKQITEEEMNTLLNAAYATPVGMGQYEQLHITVIENREFMDTLSDKAAKVIGKPELKLLYNAPACIVISGKITDTPALESSNASCAAENICLAATDLGLGSVYIMSVFAILKEDSAAMTELKIPQGFTPICGVAIGYPTEPLTELKENKQTIVTEFIK